MYWSACDQDHHTVRVQVRQLPMLRSHFFAHPRGKAILLELDL